MLKERIENIQTPDRPSFANMLPEILEYITNITRFKIAANKIKNINRIPRQSNTEKHLILSRTLNASLFDKRIFCCAFCSPGAFVDSFCSPDVFEAPCNHQMLSCALFAHEMLLRRLLLTRCFPGRLLLTECF